MQTAITGSQIVLYKGSRGILSPFFDLGMLRCYRNSMGKQYRDYHCHLLPAVDDGSADLDESIVMAQILSEFGFATVVCTPHMIRGCYENNPFRVMNGVTALQQHLLDAGLDLKLLPGCEHYLDEHLPELLLESVHARPEERTLLVEVPFRDGSEGLSSMMETFYRFGLTPLIAHPERCRAFDPQVREYGLQGALSFVMGRSRGTELTDEASVLAMQRAGCMFQGNLGSFAGRYGGEVRERALLFLRHGIYSCIGSDAHRPEGLAEMLEEGKAAIVSEVGEESAHELLCGTRLQSQKTPLRAF